MKKEFVTYEQALALKELGFDEKCYGHYDSTGELNTIEEYAKVGADTLHMLSKKFNSESYMKEMCSAPLKQQVFRWFREKYDLLCYIRKVGSNYWYNIDIEDGNEFEGRFDTYEEAEDACINRLIKISKQK
jgi:hypothetical protein